MNNPATGLPYGDPAAWALIADSLEDMSIAISELVLAKPPGAKAYDWLIPQSSGISIYVKIQIGSGGRGVVGRSFHFDEF